MKKVIGRRLFQQGDVLLTSGAKIPAGAKKVPRKNGRVVLAEGEQTGHQHVVDDAIDRELAELLEMDGKRYLDVKDTLTVVHEEHGPVVLEPGVYEVGIVREFDPFAEAVRQVRD